MGDVAKGSNCICGGGKTVFLMWSILTNRWISIQVHVPICDNDIHRGQSNSVFLAFRVYGDTCILDYAVYTARCMRF